MPATEQTWYNQKLLHVIFGCSSVVMLIATIWMIAQDHNRPWKAYQNEFRDVQRKQLRGRLRSEQKLQKETVGQLERQYAAAQSELPDLTLIDEFKRIAENVGEFDFDGVDDAMLDLKDESAAAADALAKFEAAQVKLRDARAAVATAADEAAQTAASTALDQAAGEVDAADQVLRDAQSKARRTRGRIFRPLNRIEAKAKHLMSQAANAKKLATARFAERTATQGLLYSKDFGAANDLQSEVDERREIVGATNAEQERTTANRDKLRALITKMMSKEDAAKKALDDANAEADRLANAIDEVDINYFSLTSIAGKKLLELPVVDCFNGPLKIDNLWTEGLMEPNGSFGQVRRFDRCTTCHRGIDKTAPGSATIPAYEKRHEVTIRLATPAVPPASSATLEEVYGITLADEGYLKRNDVTIEFIAAKSAAATAVNVSDSACASGLMEGDVIRSIGGDLVSTPRDVANFLLSPIDGFESSIEVVVERGLPEPYASHPRLDLYVGSLSPHKMTVVGCTVCHEGQGSGTSFNYASHTPNSNEQEHQWWRDYGWFSNHHWIYPMHPARFAESSCLKCHFDVVELGASERFPDTPAPKLLAGHNLIQAYGCFGCHEINGYKSKTERVGPDLRLEPNYFAAAAQLLHDDTFQAFPEEDQATARRVVAHPEDAAARHRLLAIMQADAQSESPKLSATAQKLTEVLGDIDIPGELRKAGPSLRHVGTKVGESFLYDWIREPKNFRPNTKMPQFFGLWNHIQDDEKSLEIAKKYEPVEIMGIVTYLLDKSQPMLDQVPAAEGVEPGDVERGKVAFETRGCLACHEHSAYDDANHGTLVSAPRPGVSRQLQGPDLSNVGDKFNLDDTPDANAWLYTWLRNPNLYHPRTKMPNLYLTPQPQADGTTTDPAADIAAFLLDSSNGWKPTDPQLTPNPADVREVALEYLKSAFFKADAEIYLEQGIPEEIGATLKGNEVELVNRAGSDVPLERKLLNYIGAKTISKYGCYGCHDIPGFESAKPIGVALADWGRKDASKIAFEHIAEYIAHGHGGHGHGDGHAAEGDGHDEEHGQADDHGDAGHEDDHGEEEIDEHFYTHRLKHHDRTGFIWQKLKEPRSYDYKKARNKDYNEKLRMPQFPFTDQQREQVITFILGLVAEPPADQFVYHPDERQAALIEGKKVLDKYNCAACHVLETERWEIDIRSGEFEAPLADTTAHPFTNAELPPDQLSLSSTPHKQSGSLSAVLEGMPSIVHPAREDNAQPVLLEYDPLDEEWYPVEDGVEYDPNAIKRALTLWKPSAVDGYVRDVGQTLEVAASAIKKRHLAQGGDLTLRLLPRVLEIERATNPAAKGGETWGWLPPSLHNEGLKVQPEWLHSFLLEPYTIRPATFMRMPQFNMSPAEATAIVNYFAARDNAEFPYEYVERMNPNRLDQLESDYVASAEIEAKSSIERLHAAMDVVTYKDYCVSCHAVGDYEPTGSLRAKAPNLSQVYKRLRGDYVRKWIAKPGSVLPYTPMPVVIPYAGQQLVPQTLFHGTSTEQLDGVVDLLMNYDRYAAGRATIKDMIKVEAETASGNPTQSTIER